MVSLVDTNTRGDEEFSFAFAVRDGHVTLHLVGKMGVGSRCKEVITTT